ncbi:MAG TPA: hypothetical protein VMH83_14825 [Candidatus Acidoferrum sp.]|nr:hypothetical protein [Candidatus Acidoferrum sp.]
MNAFATALIALPLIVAAEPARAAVAPERWRDVATATAADAKTTTRDITAPTTVDERFDAGYFRLQREPCVPLLPGLATAPRALRLVRSTAVVDATLSFHWRLVQHRLASLPTPRPPTLCYYFSP